MHWSWGVLWLAVLHVATSKDYASDVTVELFQRYIRINTTSNNDLSEAVEFWNAQAKREGVEMTVLNFTEGYPVIVLKWPGTNSSLSSIMLNSHMDVVSADEADGWTYPPFSAHLDKDGIIWGRGTQDTKSISIQYFEALKRLKAKKVSLLRDVYMTLMPDEEIGGNYGMKSLLLSKEFTQMNVGFELDEGSAINMSVIPIFYQDKVPWQIRVDCYATPVHGSMFPPFNVTAPGICHNVVNRLLEFRESQDRIYKKVGLMHAGKYTSVNLSILKSGSIINIIPGHVSVSFDIRLNTRIKENHFETQLNEWIKEAAAGGNFTLFFIQKDKQSPATNMTKSNPYWNTIVRVAKKLKLRLMPLVSPGSTDARFVRRAGYPAFGFSPMPKTETLVHSVNERLSAATFLKGIDIYEELIQRLANIPGHKTSADPSVYVYKTNK
ncbi:aminoacylase-1-like [Pectinophora gossypiella]|uniref:aminoacylase-1-like n=1 Tax=Pectinophora gossypiella TaxID=13191 RepID=UPI00214E9E35|nr:aminoacylase-1-like [Pectinophora gossypiella]